MTKFAKISLAAAVAVAGLTSSASAVDLEKAIKGVDVSGYVRWRSEEKSTTSQASNSQASNLRMEVTAKVPVNDNVTAVVKIENEATESDTAATTTSNFVLSREYFSYANGPVIVNVGRQDIPGRMVDASDAEGSGDGIVGLYSGGSFTLGAAYFYNNGLSDSVISRPGEDIYSLIAMGTVGPVSLYGQWAGVVDLGNFYNVGFDASINIVKFGLEYTALDADSDLGLGDNDDYDTFKAYVGVTAGIFSANLAYIQNGKDGNGAIDMTDSDAASLWSLWQMDNAKHTKGSNYAPDFEAWALTASVKATDKITISAGYADGDYGKDTDTDLTEIMGQVSYKMSKNLNTYLRVSNLDDEALADDTTRGRIEIKYSF